MVRGQEQIYIKIPVSTTYNYEGTYCEKVVYAPPRFFKKRNSLIARVFQISRAEKYPSSIIEGPIPSVQNP